MPKPMTRSDSLAIRAGRILGLIHLGVFVAYATGRAVSSVPFSASAVRTAINSPFVPAAHFVAAVALLVALYARRWQAPAALLSAGVMAAYAAALFFAAEFRQPQLGLVGSVAVAGLAFIALVLFVAWADDGRH